MKKLSKMPRGNKKDVCGQQEKRNAMGKNIWQIIKFILVGVSNTIVSEAIYTILVFFKMHYLLASFIGFSLSVLNAYYWNNKYVFKEQEDAPKRVWWKVLFRTYTAYLWGYLVSAVLLIIWIDFIHVSQWMEPLGNRFVNAGYDRLDAQFLGNLLAAVLNLMITVPLNFVINKYWAFKQKE